MPSTHLVSADQQISIADLATSGHEFHDQRDQAEREFKQLRKEFIEFQRRLYAEGKQQMLIVLQAMDAGGKDSTIRKMTQGINPQGVRVTSFKKPSTRERSHDFLWRVHQAVPAKGMIGVFNRSHYEDVLVVRVDKLVPQQVWEKRYEQINQFEALLAESGTTILKFFLHISRDEQKERFQDRLDDPAKHWKFSHDDLAKREQWAHYMEAFETVLQRCSTNVAPWYAIPADQKWYRDLAIMRVIVDAARKMSPQYPPDEEGLNEVVIPD